MANDYSTITELPYSQVTQTQLKRVHQRYMFAKEYCNNRDVIELGCGGGQGLAIISDNAHSVIGCDIDDKNIAMASTTYESSDNITIIKMNF